MQVRGLARDALIVLSTSEKKVEMSSGSIVCTTRLPLWGVVMAAGDDVYIAIKKSISCC